jgi:uncharacterized protein YehS (DUF1456 family)
MGHAGDPIDPEDAAALLGSKEQQEAGIDACSDDALRQFLDGLIVDRRGPLPAGAPPRQTTGELTNNDVLKKLRIALTLMEPDIHAILSAGGQPMSKGEVSALYRKPNHKNYRPAGDQVLRKFLRGLTQRLRP